MLISKILPMVALAAIAVGICSPVDAQDMRLIYNIDTGNVQIEVINNMISLFSIETRDSTQANNTGFLLFNNVASPNGLGDPNTANRDTISWLDGSGNDPFDVGTYDIGNIFDTGIVFQANSNETISSATDADGSDLGFGALGYTITGLGDDGVRQQSFETVRANAIPEPTTLPLIVMASSLLLNRRRRR